MKRKIKKIIAGILFASMLTGNVSMNVVYGTENYGDRIEENQSASIEDGGKQFTEEDNTQNQNQNKTEDGLNEDQSSVNTDATEGTEQEVESGKIGITYGKVNFVYIESPYVQTPGTQRIVFSFDKEITGAETIALMIEDEEGNQEEWNLAKQSGTLYLFEKEYAQGVSAGIYKATNLLIKSSAEEKKIALDDIGVKAEFGVDTEYEGIEELKPVEGQFSEEESSVETSVVTIDENGVAEAQDNIAEALEVVSADRMNTVSTYGNASDAKSGNIVVALDPGHDANDAGAQGYGLREEDLTLKIANYCKQELEQYAGVTVYMTRTGAACPYNKPGITCMEDRVKAAVNAGAKIFVSFHLNSSVSSAASGAEVIVPNNSWKAEVGAAGRKLGEAILDELVAIGLGRRSVYSKDTTINEKYPDGSISDYFSVQIHCKEHGIPGLIVEHAFLSNGSDVNNFLKTESGLKKLGVADATGIARYLGLQKMGVRVNVPEGTYTLDSVLASGKGIKISNDLFTSGAGTVLSTKKENISSAKHDEVKKVNNENFNFKGRNFLTLLDYTPEEIRYLLDLSKDLKDKKHRGIEHRYLNGKNIVLLFEKTSTRTRCAFEVAGLDLGMGVTYLDPGSSQMGKKESIADTAKVLGRMYDGIEYRGYDQKIVEELAKNAGVPVWNGLTTEFHPTQMLADVMTVEENFGHLDGIKLVFMGDARNNVANSLMVVCAKMGMHFVSCGPKELWPDKKLIEKCKEIAKETGGSIEMTEDVVEASKGADVIYTDVWVSMGEPDDVWADRIKLLSPYQVNMKVMDNANPNAIFLHCLPSFHDLNTTIGKDINEKFGLKEMEVTDEVFTSSKSKVFGEAENRLHTIKAVVYATMREDNE